MKNRKILVVDDENKSRLLLTEILGRIAPEADIQSADHPLLALEMLNKENYDLLFLDYDMPQLNGIEMMQKIEVMNSPPTIVLISAFREFDFAQKGIEIGALEYIIKPFNNKQISRVIESYKKKFPVQKIVDTDILILSTNQGDCLIKHDSICLIEVENRNMLKVYLEDGTQLVTKSSLHKMQVRLPENFVYITRQCIVNRNMIKMINPKANKIIVFNGNEEAAYPCSRNPMKNFVKWRDSYR